MNRPIAIALAAALACCVSFPAVAKDGGTRYVLTFTGPGPAFQIERGTKKLAPKNGLALEAGDCITILQRTHEVKTGDNENRMSLLIDGREVDLGANLSHYCVGKAGPNTNPVALAIARTLASLASVFHTAQDDYYSNGMQPAVSRGLNGPPPTIPLLLVDHAKIAEGHTTLAVAWSGGRGPFDIKLYRQDSEAPIAERKSVTARFVLIDKVKLTVEGYRLQVTDGYGASATGGFRVVPSGDLPPLSADEHAAFAGSVASSPIGRAAYAAWLMHNGSDWYLEAYQQVAPYRSSSQLAKVLIFEMTGQD